MQRCLVAVRVQRPKAAEGNSGQVGYLFEVAMGFLLTPIDGPQRVTQSRILWKTGA
jgi:hypothetical protein